MNDEEDMVIIMEGSAGRAEPIMMNLPPRFFCCAYSGQPGYEDLDLSDGQTCAVRVYAKIQVTGMC